MKTFNQVRDAVVSRALLLTTFALFATAAIAQGQEHPAEHPGHAEEHPSSQSTSLTKETLAQAIEGYISKESTLKGGYFLVYDTKNNEPLALTLDKVHKDRLATIGNGVYFACADFKATNGKMYDVDVFMKENEGQLEPTEITVHKENGKARYTWYKSGDTWKKKAVAEK